MTTNTRRALLLLIPALLAGACSNDAPPPQPPPPPPNPSGAVTPCATCKVIVIKMTTTEAGNYFEPAKLEAHEGDVLRFTLVTGVHNVNFLPDSNKNISGLPPASDLLQLPGQTKDVLLNFGEGRFYFQCDPHALLGMVGHVKVEERRD